MYNEKVMEHFRNPRNMGDLEDKDVEIEVGNPACGDLMKVFLKVGEKKGVKIIEGIKFKTFGCGAAIATSSVATELVKGESLDDAEKLEFRDISEELGDLPNIKMHCSQLASVGVHEAIYQYRKKNNMEISEKLEKSHEEALNTLEATEEKREQI